MIEDLLQSRIGLNVDSVGMKKIDADILVRMKERGISSRKDYEALLDTSKEEFNELVNIITVPETWFFRSMSSFEFLEKYIRLEWLRKNTGKIRILSIPCSTGEEAYSIAITLLDCGFAPDDFSVEGADINTVSLKKAARAVYTKNSFRGSSEDFKKRYFREKDGFWELNENIKKTVSFFSQNLLEYFLPPLPENKYDIIFCRNMLIYFDVPSQGEAMDILTGLLKEDGILFLGHAESGVLLDRDYEPVEAKGSFAFRKVKRRNERISFLTDTQKIYKAELDRQLSARKRKYIEKEKVVKKVKKLLRKEEREPEARKMENFLDKAKAYADRGMLEEAENICRQHMAENKLDPEAYFLLGLISMSLRKYSDAEGFFNKTVYLKPDHYDALINLSAIKERAGDHKAALRFRDRAERTGAFKK